MEVGHFHIMLLLQYFSPTCLLPPQVTNTDQTTISLISSGNVINLASNDVQRLDYVFRMCTDWCAKHRLWFHFLQAFLFLHYLWLGPLYVIVYTYLVYQEVGPAAFLATAFVVIQIPLQMVLAKLFAFFKYVFIDNNVQCSQAIKCITCEPSHVRIRIYTYKWRDYFVDNILQKRLMSGWAQWRKLFLQWRLSKCIRGRVRSIKLSKLLECKKNFQCVIQHHL